MIYYAPKESRGWLSWSGNWGGQSGGKVVRGVVKVVSWVVKVVKEVVRRRGAWGTRQGYSSLHSGA